MLYLVSTVLLTLSDLGEYLYMVVFGLFTDPTALLYFFVNALLAWLTGRDASIPCDD